LPYRVRRRRLWHGMIQVRASKGSPESARGANPSLDSRLVTHRTRPTLSPHTTTSALEFDRPDPRRAAPNTVHFTGIVECETGKEFRSMLPDQTADIPPKRSLCGGILRSEECSQHSPCFYGSAPPPAESVDRRCLGPGLRTESWQAAIMRAKKSSSGVWLLVGGHSLTPRLPRVRARLKRDGFSLDFELDRPGAVLTRCSDQMPSTLSSAEHSTKG